MKHTPGPWVVSQEQDGVYVRAVGPFPDDWYVARMSNNNGATKANARLVAAAPDLLDTLKHLARGTHEWSVREEARQFMEQAISKAEGR